MIANREWVSHAEHRDGPGGTSHPEAISTLLNGELRGNLMLRAGHVLSPGSKVSPQISQSHADAKI